MLTVPYQLDRILTRGRRFIPEVDGLRFIAITAVILFHLRAYTLGKHMGGATIQPLESRLVSLLSVGHYGVELFFVLSGFLLATPFAKWRLGLGARPSLRTYYLRRLTRLEPPYIVLMALTFIGGLFVFGTAAGLSRWPNLIASLLYQHNILYGTPSIVATVAWSLEIEVQFYCLAPSLAVLFSISNVIVRRVSLLAIIVALPVFRSFIPTRVGVRFNCLPWHLEFFIVGFLLADVFLVDWREAPVRSFAWDLLSLAAWPALIALMLWQQFTVLIAPVILLAYIGGFRGKVSSWALSRPVITTIGGMCYSIYLLHYTLISLIGRLFTRVLFGSNFIARFGFDAIILIPSILVITAIIFAVLERPCMDPLWFARAGESLRRLARRARAETVPPAQPVFRAPGMTIARDE